MFVRVRVPARSLFDRLAPTRIARFTWAAIGVTLVVLYLGWFVIDPTPHLPPDHSVGLTLAALIALIAQCGALGVCLHDQAAHARRRAAGEQSGVNVVFDPALPIGRHRSAAGQ
jgi:hypothetical protein